MSNLASICLLTLFNNAVSTERQTLTPPTCTSPLIRHHWRGPSAVSPLSLATLPGAPVAIPPRDRSEVKAGAQPKRLNHMLKPRQELHRCKGSAAFEISCAWKNVRARWCTDGPGCRKWSWNTQQDKKTTLNQADGGDVGPLQMEPKMFHQSNRRPEARLSSSRLPNKPYDEGTNTFARGSRGNRAGTQSSHLRNHNRADCPWWAWELQRPSLLNWTQKVPLL